MEALMHPTELRQKVLQIHQLQERWSHPYLGVNILGNEQEIRPSEIWLRITMNHTLTKSVHTRCFNCSINEITR